ncbi:transcriptional regulator [Citrobacter sp. NCU1]|uniref:StbB family protein n=1 Tax=Citrobacter sp. NCU1 TaxID=2026683 RepID=UPI0013909582|nr:StbB family protein [Citrobacter sp. NCU1]NDO80929.1 transcriptional regulator [Citrobacter sp. NCU1]
MYIKLAVVNNSGNVGKSTIAKALLKPRLADSEIIKVETINTDGTNDEKLSAKEFDEIIKRIDDVDCTIIDVGSSNIEQFLVQMNEYQGSHDLIDYFIVPVVKETKQQEDSIQTIHNLMAMGVDKERFKVVFNQADKDTQIEKQYSIFLSDKTCKQIVGKIPVVVYHNNIFNILTKMGMKYDDVYNDDRDFRTLIRAAGTKEEREELSNLRTAKMLMNGFNSDLDLAFENLSF